MTTAQREERHRSASDKEIKKAYRDKALLYHTDKDPENRPMFEAISEAKYVLLDPKMRPYYDSNDYEKMESKFKATKSTWSFGNKVNMNFGRNLRSQSTSQRFKTK
jgi:DnaJ family protein B protein 11